MAISPHRQDRETRPAVGVLIADADDRVRSLLRWLLDHDGRYDVVGEVVTGEELASYPGRPDLVIVDLTIPGLNAYEAVCRFRSSHPDATIVVLSSVDAPYLRQAMAAAGAEGYIVTTTPTADLLDILMAHVSADAAGLR